MRAQVPTVASAVGAIPEVLDNGSAGLLIRPRDVDDLVAAIKSLLDDAEFAERFEAPCI